ncbi:MAG: hypothetical protein CMO55_02465 [Verrucomicrobiales bacterium]|nr:hypothetical protein [Verrucomicrobiales bacterium]
MNSILALCQSFEVPVKSFAAGDTVFQEGEVEDILMVLIDGKVEVEREGVTISTLTGPGSVFGEVSILVGGAHTATVKAVEESRFYEIQDGTDFLKANPELGLQLAYVLAARLKAITASLAQIEHESEDRQEEADLMAELVGSLMRNLSGEED